jgi:hypothetical protein
MGCMRKSKSTKSKECTWRIVRITNRGIYLGTIAAPDRQAAIRKAAREFQVEATCLLARQEL